MKNANKAHHSLLPSRLNFYGVRGTLTLDWTPGRLSARDLFSVELNLCLHFVSSVAIERINQECLVWPIFQKLRNTARELFMFQSFLF